MRLANWWIALVYTHIRGELPPLRFILLQSRSFIIWVLQYVDLLDDINAAVFPVLKKTYKFSIHRSCISSCHTQGILQKGVDLRKWPPQVSLHSQLTAKFWVFWTRYLQSQLCFHIRYPFAMLWTKATINILTKRHSGKSASGVLTTTAMQFLSPTTQYAPQGLFFSWWFKSSDELRICLNRYYIKSVSSGRNCGVLNQKQR